MDNLPLCVLQYIIEFLDFKSQIQFTSVNKTNYNKLYTVTFSNYYVKEVIECGFIAHKLHVYNKFKIDILKQKRFKKIKILKYHVTNEIDVKPWFSCFDLKELHISSESTWFILDLWDMPNLEFLSLKNLIIAGCKYKYLKVHTLRLIMCFVSLFNNFPEATDVLIMCCKFLSYTSEFIFPKLITLACMGGKITYNHISKLNPKILYIALTKKVTDVSFMTNLKVIHVQNLDYKIPPNCSVVTNYFKN